MYNFGQCRLGGGLASVLETPTGYVVARVILVTDLLPKIPISSKPLTLQDRFRNSLCRAPAGFSKAHRLAFMNCISNTIVVTFPHLTWNMKKVTCRLLSLEREAITMRFHVSWWGGVKRQPTGPVSLHPLNPTKPYGVYLHRTSHATPEPRLP